MKVESYIDGYPDELKMRVSHFITQAYRHSQGNCVAEFRQLCFDELQALISFDSGCWGEYQSDESCHFNDNVWVYRQAANEMKGSQTFFKKPLQALRPKSRLLELDQATRYPTSTSVQKAFYDSQVYLTCCKPMRLSHNLTTLQKHEDSIYKHLISLFRADAKAFYSQQDVDIKTFIVPHLIEAQKLNALSMGNREKQRVMSYKAACDELGQIREAEDGFYKLLAAEIPNWNRKWLPIDLQEYNLAAQLTVGNAAIAITKFDGIYYLEARINDHPLKLLTKKERSVAELLSKGLKTKAMALQLASSPRTVEKHLASIYKKLGTTSKNDTLAYLLQHKKLFDDS
jgi:DNA-binding CsgD family transcriptional regulator